MKNYPVGKELKDVHTIICIKMSRDIHTVFKLICAHAPLITHMGYLSCELGFVLRLICFVSFIPKLILLEKNARF